MATSIIDPEAGFINTGHFLFSTAILGDGVFTADTLAQASGYADVYAEAMRATPEYDIPAGAFVWLSFDGQCAMENFVACTGAALTAEVPAASGCYIVQVRSNEPALSMAYLEDTAL